jgi:hypothetical protein
VLRWRLLGLQLLLLNRMFLRQLLLVLLLLLELLPLLFLARAQLGRLLLIFFIQMRIPRVWLDLTEPDVFQKVSLDGTLILHGGVPNPR